MKAPKLVRIPTLFEGPVIGAVVDPDLKRFDLGFGNKPGCFRRIGRMQIDGQLAAHATAQELIHRHVQRFARQIPERHFHSADSGKVRSSHAPHEEWRGGTPDGKMLPTPEVKENSLDL